MYTYCTHTSQNHKYSTSFNTGLLIKIKNTLDLSSAKPQTKIKLLYSTRHFTESITALITIKRRSIKRNVLFKVTSKMQLIVHCRTEYVLVLVLVLVPHIRGTVHKTLVSVNHLTVGEEEAGTWPCQSREL